jgi:uncharacterized sulfatase
MNRYPIRAVRTPQWKYIRNLDPSATFHSHVDKAAGEDGRDYWDSWIEKTKTDPAAAAVVRRYLTRPAEELFDLTTDPWELHNLAAEPAHALILKTMRGELDTWMKKQDDEGLLTERSLPDPTARKEKR